MSEQAATMANDANQVAQYHADGFVVVKGVFGHDRVAELTAEAERLRLLTGLIHTDNIRCRWQTVVETGECRFDCFDPVIDLSEAFAGLARDERIIRAVSAVYGEPA